MRTEAEVRSFLFDHNLRVIRLFATTNSEELRLLAKEQHRTVEWVRGYLTGVQDAYNIVLGEKVV